MTSAYVDTSCLVAILFDELGGSELAQRLARCDRLFASNFLEAELRSTLAREGVDSGAHVLSWLTWVYAGRPLADELTEVLRHGYLRGADAWHLACALLLSGEPGNLLFATLDQRQGEVAAALGFSVL